MQKIYHGQLEKVKQKLTMKIVQLAIAEGLFDFYWYF